MSCEPWVGLVEVAQDPGISLLGPDRGAHVSTIAWSDSEADFCAKVAAALSELGLTLVEAEEIETCASRTQSYEVSEEFLERMRAVNAQTPVLFADFHSFPLDE